MTISSKSITQFVLTLGFVGVLAYANTVSAAPCESVPDCEEQKKTPVRYGTLDAKGWAYYCTGDHPYYWNTDAMLGFGNNFSFDNRCFTVVENPFAESQLEPSKMDATITNRCLKQKDITITNGCSKQPSSIPCKDTTTGPIKDPGCPVVSGTYHNACATSGPVSVCVQTWEEKCASGPVYCTDAYSDIWCYRCDS